MIHCEPRSLDAPAPLATLQKEFPFQIGVKRADGTLRLFWCMEKPHSMVHWASNQTRPGGEPWAGPAPSESPRTSPRAG